MGKNFKESEQILERIKKANNILINCHRSPDPDSIGSSLGLKDVLVGMGKNVKVISPSELDEGVSYLKGFSEIEVVDYKDFDFSKFDLFLVSDSATKDQITEDTELPFPPIIVVDHHSSNPEFGEINLIDGSASSVGEVIFLLLEDWGLEISKSTADCLIAAIVGDTGGLRYPNVTSRTLEVSKKLVDSGGDRKRAVFEIYQNYDWKTLKMVGNMLENLKIDEGGKFAWVAVSHEEYKEYGDPIMAKDIFSSYFMSAVKGTDFGFVILEIEKGKSSVSFRSRESVDVSKIAIELGGGGHKEASGARIDMPFDEAVKKIIDVAKKYGKD